MTITFSSLTWGMLLLGFWLIITCLMSIFGFSFRYSNIVLGVLGLLAGIFILIGI